MPIIFDTGVLTRPSFDPAAFTPTQWDTGADKAAFANALCRFIAADFKLSLFTDKLYQRLYNTFGHIAHTNKHGFISDFFEDPRGKVEFLEQTLMWRPCGDPAWTYSDVEHAVLKRLRTCNLLDAYRALRALRAAEVERAERELLRRLQMKYASGTTPAQPPILHRPAAPRTTASRTPPEQSSLF
jgi:hypothetical protein